MENQTTSSPSWNEIFKEIGTQVHTRTGLLSRRVLLISAPTLVFFFLVWLIIKTQSGNSWMKEFSQSYETNIVLWFTAIIIILAIVMIISMAIFKVEEIIWLDSYFDNKNLTSAESWSIAKKLYFPWNHLQRKLFFKYYIWIIISIISIVALGIYVFVIKDTGRLFTENVTITISSLYIILSGIVLITWTRYLKIKLSYAPFLFLDRFAGNTDSQFWNDFFSELAILNNVSKGESFKKNVMLEISADIAVSLVDHIVSQMSIGGGTDIVLLAGKEVAYRIVYFAKMTGRCVLYRFAFRVVHGGNPSANQYMYDLKN